MTSGFPSAVDTAGKAITTKVCAEPMPQPESPPSPPSPPVKDSPKSSLILMTEFLYPLRFCRRLPIST
jgi:hypothetical protein